MQSLPSERIENNLILAIVITVLCCLPFGIVGIVYAAQVNPKALTGDLSGARESARKAKLWSLWGLGLGLVVYGLYFLLAMLSVISDSAR
jgi:Interferon-induced transmembrane protein